MNRVVVTGIGIVSPIGNNTLDFWENLKKGKSGIDRITKFNVDNFPTKIAGFVKDFDATEFLTKKEIKRAAPFVQFAVAAAYEAIKNSNLKISSNSEEIGVIIGSGIGGLDIIEEQHKILLEKGCDRVSPFFIPMIISNMASAVVAMKLGIKGPNSCPVTACSSGANAIGDAYHILKRGEASAIIAGGTEASITPLGLAGFCSAKALSTRNDDPTRSSRPFDSQRDGFVMSEGAGVLLLETLEHAKARNALILAEIIGYAFNSDAYHITLPDPEGYGIIKAMKKSIEYAGISYKDVDYINAHGTSTPINDRIETKAIKSVFKEHAYKVSISSTKSMTGHLLGAAGGIEAAVCVLSIVNNIIPPTINQEYKDPECDLDYVPNYYREKTVNIAMSNSMGFGGHNTSIIFKKYEF